MYILNVYIDISILNNLHIFNRDRQYYGEDMLKFSGVKLTLKTST